jgi:LPS-assembly protein
MKSKIFIIFLLIFFKFFFVNAEEEFNFNVSEIEITNDGNIFRGLNRGTATTNNTKTIITADFFEYDKIKNILIASGDVIIEDLVKDYKINSNHISYFKEEEKIFSKGRTIALMESKYKIISSDIYLYRKNNFIESNKFTKIIDDKFNEYETDLFQYSIDSNLFKGKNIILSSNLDKSANDKEIYKFKDGIFDLKKKDIIASDTKIYFKKNIFGETQNDPRIYGRSSKKKEGITEINKAIFTNCKLTGDCPPWSIKASKITHDQNKKDIIYDNSVLKFYEFPVFYFPKFVHADPTTRRRSGFLQPRINASENNGSSISIPYFYMLSETDDLTLKPTIFDSDIYMFHGEYRKETDKSALVTDIGLTKGYKDADASPNNIGHFFSKFTSNLNLDNFVKSNLNLSIQKTTKDTFLKIFDSNLGEMNQKIKPQNQNKLESNIDLELEHKNFNLNTGLIAYENLNGLNSDRYQYVLPYYNFSKNLYENNLFNLNFYSTGSNNLKETNKLESSINNNFDLFSKDFFSNLGFKNNINIHFKNLNTLGKNIENKKSSPSISLQNIINLETSLPLLKYYKNSINTITPKASFRVNPTDMGDSSNEQRDISVDNIFDINRLGLEDLEQGKSLTLGIDYKKESLQDINKFFEIKFAGVLRDVNQKNIPSKSSINQKTSNLFGSATYNLSKNINVDYDFSIDNDLKSFEKNIIGLNFSFLEDPNAAPKFNTNFSFAESNGKMGDTNVLSNTTTYNFKDDNYLSFQTRRNRKLNFTEYYDLVYQYKNDCLVAGIKFKKTYYQDRDLKPQEDLLFTITFFPITQYEQRIDQTIWD